MGIRCNVLLYIATCIGVFYSVHEHMYDVISEILITCGDPRLIISFKCDSRDMQILFLSSYQLAATFFPSLSPSTLFLSR